MKNRNFLAIIPARSGSKRLPNKNIKDLRGQPLISYTIQAALNSKYINETVVTTDCEEIKNVAKKFGANTPFLRPSYLAQDDSTSIDVAKHCIEFYKNTLNKEYDFIVFLQPTSPLRDEKDIDKAIEFLIEKDADCVISVCEMEHNPIWSNTLDETKNMNNFLDEKYINRRTQDLPKYYRINGAIYICRVKKLLEENRLLLKNNIFAYEMSQEKSIDIDTNLDFLITKTLLDSK
jgi:CMP-N,N'-diacetyllegionaminic acid synthase